MNPFENFRDAGFEVFITPQFHGSPGRDAVGVYITQRRPGGATVRRMSWLTWL